MKNSVQPGRTVHCGDTEIVSGQFVRVGALVGVATGVADLIETEGVFNLPVTGSTAIGDAAYADEDGEISKTAAEGSFRFGVFLSVAASGKADIRLDGVSVVAEPATGGGA